MACIKSAQRPVLIASAPELPYLAAGTASGTAVDERFSASATIEIYRLDLGSSSPDLPLRAATPAPRRFSRLCWSRPVAAQGDSFSLGLLAGGLCDGSVALWNPLTLISPEGQAEDAMVARLVKQAAPVRGLAFSALTPTQLVSGAGPGEVHIWDLNNARKPTVCKTIQSVAQDAISYLAWNTKSPNMLASTSNNGMTVIWDLREQKQSTSFSDSDRRKCSVLEWNPDISNQLIVASDDDDYPSLKVWDLRKTISPRQEFVGHSKGVTAIAWCPYDSSSLLSCSKDNRTLCWDTISGKIINELPSSSSGIFDLHWCRNVPNVIAASSLDGKIGIYKFSSLDAAGKSAVGGPETVQSATEYQVIDEVANCCSNKAAASLDIQAVLSAVPRKPRTLTTRTSSIKTAAVVKPRTASSIITRSMKSVASEKNEVCIVYNACMLKHQGNMTNEVPGRIDAIMKKLKQDGLLKKCDIVDAHAVDFEHVLAVHTMKHFEVILDLPLEGKEKEDAYKSFFGIDIEYCSYSKNAILAAAGAIIQLGKNPSAPTRRDYELRSRGPPVLGVNVLDIVTGQYKHAFAVIRPPGHHASRNKGSGFCFINNIALGARYLIKEKHAEKVMIVDFDYHHGDGTQSIFFDNDRVLTFSIHRDGVFPNNTKEEAMAKCGDYIGIGKGEGFNVNVNLTEAYGDGDMLAIFKHILVPVVKSFSPDYILVSAGFDAALGDKIGDCKVTPEGYSAMTSILSNIGNKKLVLALEGGYGERSLSRSVSACVKSLVATGEGFHEKVILRDKKLKVRDSTWKTINEVHGHLLPYWPILKGHSIPRDVLKRLPAKPAAH